MSIIIPNLNKGHFFHECLKSCFAVKEIYKKVEVIVVDYGSRDNSCDVIQELVEDYRGRMSVSLYNVRNLANRQYAGAINKGLIESSGNVILHTKPEIILFPEETNRYLFRFFKKETLDIIKAPVRQGKELVKDGVIITRYCLYNRYGMFCLNIDSKMWEEYWFRVGDHDRNKKCRVKIEEGDPIGIDKTVKVKKRFSSCLQRYETIRFRTRRVQVEITGVTEDNTRFISIHKKRRKYREG